MQDAFSTATPAVVGGSVQGPAPTIGPSVTGYAIEGQALSAQTGIWKGVGSVLFAFRWYRCDADGGGCRPIPDATQSIYTTDAEGRRRRRSGSA